MGTIAEESNVAVQHVKKENETKLENEWISFLQHSKDLKNNKVGIPKRNTVLPSCSLLRIHSKLPKKVIIMYNLMKYNKI